MSAPEPRIVTSKRARLEISYGTLRIEVDFRTCVVIVHADDPDFVSVRDPDETSRGRPHSLSAKREVENGGHGN